MVFYELCSGLSNSTLEVCDIPTCVREGGEIFVFSFL